LLWQEPARTQYGRNSRAPRRARKPLSHLIFSYLADFSAEFHDIRGADFSVGLGPESYVTSQELAEQLLEAGSLGLVYPSVRKPEGTCLACFRPALVTNVRQGRAYLFRWDGKAEPMVTGRA
jgi:RES domain